MAQPITPKLYLEHSGSMFGYDGPTVDGNLRRTIVDLINTFPKPKQVMISIVNDKVYPYPQSFINLVKSPNLFQSKIGNPAYTDFSQIFSTIIAGLHENEVAILTTDLIYSDKGSGGQLASRVADVARSLAELSLKQYTKDGSLLVWQIQSGFNGYYYSFDRPNVGRKYRGNRPVYVLFFARNVTMARLLTDPAYATFRNTTRYPGFQNAMLFSNSSQQQHPFYTIDEFDPEAKGSFDKDRDGNKNRNGIHAIKNLSAPRRQGEQLTLSVAIALPTTYGPALTDPASYKIESLQDGFKLKAIRLADGRTDGATHRLLLEATQPGGSGERTVTIRLKRQFPPGWVKTCTTLDDTRPSSTGEFARQTFGLEQLLTGVQTAYDAHASDKLYHFSCSLFLKN